MAIFAPARAIAIAVVVVHLDGRPACLAGVASHTQHRGSV